MSDDAHLSPELLHAIKTLSDPAAGGVSLPKTFIPPGLATDKWLAKGMMTKSIGSVWSNELGKYVEAELVYPDDPVINLQDEVIKQSQQIRELKRSIRESQDLALSHHLEKKKAEERLEVLGRAVADLDEKVKNHVSDRHYCISLLKRARSHLDAEQIELYQRILVVIKKYDELPEDEKGEDFPF